MASWTLELIRDNWRRMTPPSLVRYGDALVRGRAGRAREGELLRLRMLEPIRGDVWLRVEGSDLGTYREVLREQVYAPVKRTLADCGYVVDLGANIGLATRYLASVYPACRVFAVEPDPDNFRLLERNLGGLIRSGRCRAVRKAAWAHAGTVSIEVPGGDGLRSDSFYAVEVDPTLSDHDRSRLVEAITIPEIIEASGFPRVDLLKVDIEGAEAGLFEGEPNWLERVGAIAIEFHGDSRAESGFDRAMERRGFSLSSSNSHTVLAYKSLEHHE